MRSRGVCGGVGGRSGAGAAVASLWLLGALAAAAQEVPGGAGRCLRFDGTNDCVEVPHAASLDATGTLAIEAWVNLDDPAADQKIIGKLSHNPPRGYVMSVRNSRLFCELCDSAGGYYVIDAGTVPARTWTHLAFSWQKNGRLIGYVNGEVVADTAAGPYDMGAGVSSLTIGRAPWGGYYVRGLIDEVRVWSVTRWLGEIGQNMYKELGSGLTGQVAYYKMNAASGTALQDDSLHGQTGTLYDGASAGNGPLWQRSAAFDGPGNCLDFDGADDCVNVPYNGAFQITQELTLEAWLRPDNVASDQKVFGNALLSPNRGYVLGLRAGRLYCEVFDSSAVRYAFEAGQIPAGAWTHVALTWRKGGRMIGYVNGQVVADVAASASDIGISFGEFVVGRAPWGGYWYDGRVDELRVWHVERSAADLRDALCRPILPGVYGLAAYYRFDQRGAYLCDNDSTNIGVLNGAWLYTQWTASGAFNTWLGGLSEAWAEAANWSRGTVPAAADNPGLYRWTAGYAPVVSNAPSVNTLLIAANAAVTLASGLTVGGALVVERDTSLNGKTVTLGPSATLVEGQGVLGGSEGAVTTTRALNAVNEDVANLGARLTSSANLGLTTVTRRQGAQRVAKGCSIARAFDIAPANNSGLNATLVFRYRDDDLEHRQETGLCLFSSSDGGASWLRRGGTLDAAANTLTLSGIGSFSRWTAAADQSVEVRGNGLYIANGDRSPSLADHTRFGAPAVTSGAVERTFTLRNAGASALALTGAPRAALAGPQAADFAVTAQPATPLASGAQTAFTVRFDPRGPGRRRALLSLANDDADESPFAFAVDGTGYEPRTFQPAFPLAALNGGNGLRIKGASTSDYLGVSAGGAGDMNGDGFDDAFVVAYGASSRACGVVFGRAGAWPAELRLTDLDGTNGFRLTEIVSADVFVGAAAGAGDVNGDGFDDLIVGASAEAPGGRSSAGSSYVVFGRSGAWPAALAASALNGTKGCRIDGAAANDYSGRAVDGAGDVNGDGLADVIIGAVGADPGGHSWAGSAYVVFGRRGAWPASIALSSLDGGSGFRFDGAGDAEFAGIAVGGAGDVNGDGYDDVVIGCTQADHDGFTAAGESCLVFGKPGGWPAALSRTALDGTNGVRLGGSTAGQWSGGSVGGGDVNGDGLSDVIIGSYRMGAGWLTSEGATYVVFGQASGWAADVSLAGLSGTNGFRVNGIDANDCAGHAARCAGDVNGDGFADLVIGAYQADPGGRSSAGESYVVFGKAAGWAPTLALASLDGASGFRLDGVAADDQAGRAVGGAGDVNGDGFDDLLVGALLADPDGRSGAGACYLVFGGGGLGVPDLRVRGNGADILAGDASPSTADGTQFGTVIASSGTVTRTFVLVNAGTTNLALSGAPLVALSGPHAAAFSVTAAPASQLAAGAETSFQLTFDPEVIGGCTAVVSIASSDYAESAYMFTVTGTGAWERKIRVRNGSTLIANGDVTPSSAEGTDYGTINVNGSWFSSPFIIANVGIAALTLTGTPAVAVTGEHAADFIVTTPPATTLAAGGSTFFQLRFDPSGGGERTATLLIASDDAEDNPYTFAVRGVGDGPEIEVSGAGVSLLRGDATPAAEDGTDFGAVPGGESVAHVFTVTNRGVTSLSLSGSPQVALTGAHAADFAVTAQPTGTVAAGAASLFSVTFTPSAPGVRSATVSLANSDADENPFTFALQGTGLLPVIGLAGGGQAIANGDSTPTAADGTEFGSLQVAGGAAAHTFAVTNAGTCELTLTGAPRVALAGPHAADFAVTLEPDAAVAAGGATAFSITFDPSATGARTATVSLASNDSGRSPYTFVVRGTGVAPAIRVSGNGTVIACGDGTPAAADGTAFGDVALAGGALERTFQVANPGTSELTLTGMPRVALSGPHAADFAVTLAPTSSVAAGATTSFRLTFDPSAAGARTATVSLACNAAADSPYVFAVAGAGVEPDLRLTGNGRAIRNNDRAPTYADGTRFGAPAGGTGRVTRSFSVLNAGTLALNLTATPRVAVSGPHAAEFTVAAQPATPVAPGGGSAFTVQFQPGGDGRRKAELTLVSDDADASPFRFALEGTRALTKTFQDAYTLALLDGTNGFRLDGAAASDLAGAAVSGAGDVNGDGFADLLVGAAAASPGGAGYVVFGSAACGAAARPLAALDGTNGFRLAGAAAGDGAGFALSAAGDVNGDGLADLVVGAPQADPAGRSGAGAAYVVFGRTNGWPAAVSLAALAGADGFRLDGVAAGDGAGCAARGAGDVNGDGVDDLLVGADQAGSGGAGAAYAVFGRRGAWPASLPLAALDGTNGFRLGGAAAGDRAGCAVSGAGDVNGDGLDDFAVGACGAAAGGAAGAGAAYVVFGRTNAWAADLPLAALSGGDGLLLQGGGVGDAAGGAVSGAGDVNGDGFGDLVVGAGEGDPGGRADAGQAYVVCGRGGAWPAALSLGALDGTNGFCLRGVAAQDHAGGAVSGAGDVNGDGYDDLVAGAPQAAPDGRSGAGAAYLVLGRQGARGAALELSALDGASGFRLSGAVAGEGAGGAAGGAGDVNGDGFDDLVVGAPQASPGGRSLAGSSYVAFGGGLLGRPEIAITGAGLALASGDDTPAQADGTDYGAVPLGSAHAQTFVILNEGTARLALTGTPCVVLSGPGAPHFAVTQQPASTLEPGASAGFEVTFAPQALGACTVTVAVASEDADETPFTFKLCGRGCRATLRLSGNGVDISAGDRTPAYADHTRFGTAAGGGAIARSFAVRNEGEYTLALTGTPRVAVSGPHAGDFVVTQQPPEALAPGASAAFSLRFTPGGVGRRRALLTVANTDIERPGFRFAVEGSGGSTRAFEPGRLLGGLDGTNGVVLIGLDSADLTGCAVSAAGDVNGDGYGDVLLGAYMAGPYSSAGGSSFLVFGKPEAWSPVTDMVGLRGPTGTQYCGDNHQDYSGFAVRAAGDVNGDGYDDMVTGAYGADPSSRSAAGSAYVLFGRASGWSSGLYYYYSIIAGTNGFRINGAVAGDNAGYAVSGAGDVNGDGLADVLVGAWQADPGGRSAAGSAYVVFGRAAGWPSNVALSSLDGTNGFRLDGITAGDNAGCAVSGAGDVNGDGLSDLLVGASQADPEGRSNAGACYVVFGRRAGWPVSLDLASLAGTNGFRLCGAAAGDNAGSAVSGAGDVNGDGYDDLLVGASLADPGGRSSAGAGYVVFGRAAGWPASLDLAALDGAAGFRVEGVDPDDRAGVSVGGAGDVNGDGLDDLILGANLADPGSRGSCGESYVLLGRAAGWPASLPLSGLDGVSGFRLDGIDTSDRSGSAVSGAGDVNGDGFDDLLVGAPYAAKYNQSACGEAYVVFGGGRPGRTIRTVVGPHGSADIAATAVVAEGSTRSIVYTADAWHRLQSLTRDGEPVAAATGACVHTQTLANITADVSNQVSFAAATQAQTGLEAPLAWVRGYYASEAAAGADGDLSQDYLLGLDPTVSRAVTMRVAHLAFSGDDLLVTVRLTDAAAPLSTTINGRLALYGCESVGGDFAELSGAVISNALFDADGACTVAFRRVPLSLFLKAKILPLD